MDEDEDEEENRVCRDRWWLSLMLCAGCRVAMRKLGVCENDEEEEEVSSDRGCRPIMAQL